jgi:hypothetical protein
MGYQIIDLTIIIMFSLEIAIKLLANSYRFFYDIFDIVDAAVVITSLTFALIGSQAKGLGLLRLLRLMRVLLMLKRVSDGRKKLQKINKTSANDANGFRVDSYLNQVLEIIAAMQVVKNLNPELKDDLIVIEDLMLSNKLYSIDHTANSSRMTAAGAAAGAGGDYGGADSGGVNNDDSKSKGEA